MLPDKIHFTKMSAGGNDFICIDNTEGVYDELLSSPHLPHVIEALCRRGLCVGADGVIFACERGSGAGIDIVARFLEPDGSEARLCGNGTACFTYWCLDAGLVPGPEVDILTAAGAAHAYPNTEDGSRIRVCVPNPRGLELGRRISAAGRSWNVHTIDTGVPHAVIFVRHVDRVDVARIGPLIRHHEAFEAMGGVNVNFTQILAEGHIRIRTFEFGVEAETLACGTGSAAAAIISSVIKDWPHRHARGNEPILVDVRGNETLKIWFTVNDDHSVVDVCLETRARAIYDGTCRYELLRELLREMEVRRRNGMRD